MKKVIQSNIGGMIFSLDDTAYTKLNHYLDEIKKHYRTDESCDDIVLDIESAFAEKLTSLDKTKGQSITESDINMIITELGTVDDFRESDDVESSMSINKPEQSSETKKRLYRNTDDGIAAGVASGIADYFEIDPLWIRLLFVGSVFTGGLGIFLYIVLWVIVPEAKSTSQKLVMRGDKVDIDSIAKYSEEKKSLQTGEVTSISKTTSFAKKISTNIFSVLQIIIGIALIVVSFVTIIGLVIFASAVAGGGSLVHADPVTMQAYYNIVATGIVGPLIASLVIVCIVPCIGLLVSGLYLLSGKIVLGVFTAVILGISWVVAISISIILALSLAGVMISSIQYVEQYMQNNPTEQFYFSWSFDDDMNSYQIINENDIPDASNTPDSPKEINQINFIVN